MSLTTMTAGCTKAPYWICKQRPVRSSEVIDDCRRPGSWLSWFCHFEPKVQFNMALCHLRLHFRWCCFQCGDAAAAAAAAAVTRFASTQIRVQQTAQSKINSISPTHHSASPFRSSTVGTAFTCIPNTTCILPPFERTHPHARHVPDTAIECLHRYL